MKEIFNCHEELNPFEIPAVLTFTKKEPFPVMINVILTAGLGCRPTLKDPTGKKTETP